jgi:hypothetical protein
MLSHGGSLPGDSESDAWTFRGGRLRDVGSGQLIARLTTHRAIQKMMMLPIEVQETLL